MINTPTALINPALLPPDIPQTCRVVVPWTGADEILMGDVAAQFDPGLIGELVPCAPPLGEVGTVLGVVNSSASVGQAISSIRPWWGKHVDNARSAYRIVSVEAVTWGDYSRWGVNGFNLRWSQKLDERGLEATRYLSTDPKPRDPVTLTPDTVLCVVGLERIDDED